MKSSNSKKFIFLTIILTIVAIGVVGYLILDQKNLIPEDENISRSIGSLFDWGGGDTDSNVLINTPDQTNTTTGRVFPRLRKLTDEPTAGAIAFQRGNEIVVRYVLKNNGHVFELPMSTDVPDRLINRTVPRIHDAIWSPQGNAVIMRYLDDGIVKAYSTPVPNTLSSTSPTGIFLPDGLEEMVVSPSAQRVLYLYHQDGYAYGVWSTFDGNDEETFSSPFNEWLLDVPNNNTLVVTPKPSYGIIGHSYAVNTDENTFTKIFGDKPALISKMNPYGDKILFSSTGDEVHTFGVFDIESEKELPIAISTTPDKCIWSALERNVAYCSAPGGFLAKGFPDVWYKGLVSYEDTALWYIDTDTMDIESIIYNNETEEVLDVVKMFTDPNETYLYFFNKKDMTLWSYQLKSQSDIVTQNEIGVEISNTASTTSTTTLEGTDTTSTPGVVDVS